MKDLISTMFRDVAAFNSGIVGVQPLPNPGLLNTERMEFRLGHMLEELNEITEAYKKAQECIQGADDVKIVEHHNETIDGLIDLIYIALGTLYEMGIPAGRCFDEVHRANMDRAPGRKIGRDIENDLDAVKPADWTPPNYEFLENFTFREDVPLKEIQPTNTSVPYPLIEAAELLSKKAQDYRNSNAVSLADYFPFGLKSHVQMINTKNLRLINLASTKRTPNHESVRDTLLDLINYCNFAIQDLDGEDLNKK